jgi:hypothetical protein
MPDMNDSDMPPSPSPRRSQWPVLLLVIAVVGLSVFALALGGLTLFSRGRESMPVTMPLPTNAVPSTKTLAALSPTNIEPSDTVTSAPVVQPAALSLSNNTAPPNDPAFTELFNGHDLEGWYFDPAIWSAQGGVIHGEHTRNGPVGSIIWRETNIGDFELRFRFRLVRGNSGLYYRAKQLANFNVSGYEFEIYTNRTGNLAESGRGRERRRLCRVAEDAEPTDIEWHEGTVIATGPRLVQMVDGKVLCEVEETDSAAPRIGTIAMILSASTIVEFKDVRLRRAAQK